LIEQANNKIAKFISNYEDQQLPSKLRKKWMKILQSSRSPSLSKQNTLKRKDLFKTNEKLDEQTFKIMQMNKGKSTFARQQTSTPFNESPDTSV